MIAMKFGGTSMGSPEMITRVGQTILAEKKLGYSPIVIVSAMSGVTNTLLQAADLAVKNVPSEERQALIDALRSKHLDAAQKLVPDDSVREKVEFYIQEKLDHFREFLFAIAVIGEISPASHDEIVALGERLSAALLAAHLGALGEFVDLAELLEKGAFSEIDAGFFETVEERLQERVSPILEAKKIPVLTGFFGKIPGGIVKGVGRGYSDFTAALAGSAFGVREIQIWTDVDGLLSADPRIVKYTCALPEVSFEEAAELAEFGAKVLHPQTIWPAVKQNISVRIKNTMNPEAIGTLITRDGIEGIYICKSVAHKKGITVITITSAKMLLAVGFLADVFTIFKKYGVSVDFVSTAEISVTITIDEEKYPIPEALFRELRKICHVDILKNQAIVCAVGSELTTKKGVLAKIFAAVADADIVAKAVSSSAQKISVSMIVAEEDADPALFALHKAVFEAQDLESSENQA